MTSGAGFGAKLAAATAERGPLCVGIDPHPGLLEAWGLPVDASGLERFALTAVEALAGEVAVLKPQSAFFEVYGSAGIAVLERTMRAAREAGALVLLDVKRGDIGSTMAAYAQAYLDDGAPLAADAVTLSPYLGFGSLRPALELAAKSGRGVFVLARTSNPEGAQLQELVAQSIVDDVAARNAQTRPGARGDVGVVVGATARHGLDLSGLGGPILAPGVGAQGARPADLRELFGTVLSSVLPSTSREVLGHGPDPVALRDGARRAVAEARAALG